MGGWKSARMELARKFVKRRQKGAAMGIIKSFLMINKYHSVQFRLWPICIIWDFGLSWVCLPRTSRCVDSGLVYLQIDFCDRELSPQRSILAPKLWVLYVRYRVLQWLKDVWRDSRTDTEAEE